MAHPHLGRLGEMVHRLKLVFEAVRPAAHDAMMPPHKLVDITPTPAPLHRQNQVDAVKHPFAVLRVGLDVQEKRPLSIQEPCHVRLHRLEP